MKYLCLMFFLLSNLFLLKTSNKLTRHYLKLLKITMKYLCFMFLLLSNLFLLIFTHCK